jgi:transcriptional regulator with XRE-family HTH domain
MRKVSGPAIKAARIAYGDSRELTCVAIGKTSRTVEGYESGQITPPANVLAALADRYGVPLDSLYADVDAAELAGAR